ncbi:MAG TPA: PDDEXK nuclease domain-containing protein [Candidatus Nanoarchaeia archaeon]|nr:PDDEXK nuclease domain-containing protein [Candidatus Nanoarchaeia archaeon]
MKKDRIMPLRENKQKYSSLINSIGALLEQGRKQAYQSVNSILVKTYWEIGKQIVEYEQHGEEKAEYGSALLDNLSKDLKIMHGRGFSKSNVYLMRQFYLKYQKFQTVSGKLSWSHYAELLSIEEDLSRQFYENQSLKENWSVRELNRQINSALFHRIALSKDKNEIINISKKGITVNTAKDIVRDPYILEFLDMPEKYKYSEKELEHKLIDNLQMFLLELGKGFTFVKRQFRITLDNTNYYVDLVFYHRLLKCFVLIDLKIGKISHADIGQMNMYLNYFKEEENSSEDNEPIGIVLSAEKDSFLVKYALGGISNNLFVSKYLLYLPDKKELENKLKKLMEN